LSSSGREVYEPGWTSTEGMGTGDGETVREWEGERFGLTTSLGLLLMTMPEADNTEEGSDRGGGEGEATTEGEGVTLREALNDGRAAMVDERRRATTPRDTKRLHLKRERGQRATWDRSTAARLKRSFARDDGTSDANRHRGDRRIR
jgi:hypothetical protein